MSKMAFDQISEGLKEAAISVRNQRVLFDQVTIAINALQSITLGDREPKAIARDALLRIAALVPEPTTTD